MRKAFTILELLAATALTALLMLAVLHVVATLGASRAALARQPDDQAARADFLDTLRRDLAGSAQVSFHAKGFTLTSHGALDRITFAPRQEPATIAYDVTIIHGRSWLVRRQSPRGGLAGQGVWTELVLPDVAEFSVRAAAMAGIEMPIDSKLDAAAQEVPAIVTMRLQGTAGQVWTQTLVLR